MNKELKAVYVAINCNQVVCFDTNRDSFVKEFLKVEPASKKQDWFYRKFKTENRFSHTINKKEYWFQKLV